MCRHLAYLGAPSSPSGPVFESEHALLVQSYAPKDMREGGTVNADGFGLGWFTGDRAPVSYRRAGPLWTDGTLRGLAGTVRSGAFVAAVRSGTPGMPVTEAACAPFADDHWLFSHNGVVRGWPDSVAGLAEKLPITRVLTMEAATDSALLWTLLAERLRAGADPVASVISLVAEVERAAPGSRLNLLLAGADVVIGTAWTHALSVLEDERGVLIASEPVDGNPDWRPVPQWHAVVARRERPGAAPSTALIPISADRRLG
ncbi:ergothioneine biosynthesis protein EgtC [Prauserella marina]|uniref:Gamma-glutamyl-hercynylcysteine sulfoxide hydrolase n=1 Tax=Prauserella marina TaxID=530584 RepID=A0A222VRT0_9PSEU|nr:ergothioneine biosynthesis protein EgtC [Prauserella marina]ASR36453.1 ergothioneine biosynthesis protein EgtC [Prauserella marina]PWV77267.1 glutamine amidotransferase [Prauserella marina]SDD08210.1 glutamine amidotransferase [Prauserella marina]